MQTSNTGPLSTIRAASSTASRSQIFLITGIFQILFSVRVTPEACLRQDRQLMEQMRYNLLSR
ncbi:hypothetical protein [Cereibacter sphaeroides]|uniref:hypothetical protein n=1 Tax=Cereibacter sphaeroides TaxID=1063 RepID=UPI003AF18C03